MRKCLFRHHLLICGSHLLPSFPSYSHICSLSVVQATRSLSFIQNHIISFFTFPESVTNKLQSLPSLQSWTIITISLSPFLYISLKDIDLLFLISIWLSIYVLHYRGLSHTNKAGSFGVFIATIIKIYKI